MPIIWCIGNKIKEREAAPGLKESGNLIPYGKLRSLDI